MALRLRCLMTRIFIHLWWSYLNMCSNWKQQLKDWRRTWRLRGNCQSGFYPMFNCSLFVVWKFPHPVQWSMLTLWLFFSTVRCFIPLPSQRSIPSTHLKQHVATSIHIIFFGLFFCCLFLVWKFPFPDQWSMLTSWQGSHTSRPWPSPSASRRRRPTLWRKTVLFQLFREKLF